MFELFLGRRNYNSLQHVTFYEVVLATLCEPLVRPSVRLSICLLAKLLMNSSKIISCFPISRTDLKISILK